jgi:predicted RNA methylase
MQSSQFAGPLTRFASRFVGVPLEVTDLVCGAGMMAIGLSILAISPTFAADEQCHAIKSDKGRLACFDREASSAKSGNREARPATAQKEGAFVDPAEWLRSENDKVADRLKGICRGC